MTVQPKKKSHVEGNCSVCFEEKGSYRAVLKYPTRVVKVVLIGVRCLSDDGLRRFFSEKPWKMERI